MKVLLTTLNAKYIHKNLALRWLYVSCPTAFQARIQEFTIKEDLDTIANQLLEAEEEVIALSVYIWNIEETKYIIKKIKEKSNKHIIVGGPEVTYESFYLVDEGVDAISLGEGELSFWCYILMVDNKAAYEVEGIYTKAFPNTKVMKMDLTYNESLENPYFLDIDEKEMHNRYFYFETSRGCPYHCEYCLSSTDTQVRMFSEEYIFAILEKISTSNIRIVKLLDRTFNVMPKRALAIAKYMNTYCHHQIFQFEIVAETLSEELLTFFCEEADKNRFRFEIGIQSFQKKTLEAVGRMQNNERLVEVIKRLQAAGVTMHVDLIAGLPYEGIELFKESFNTLYDLHTDEIQLGILKLLKGTALKRKQEEYDYIFEEKPPYNVVETKWLSKQEMVQIEQCAHAVEKFYNSGRCRRSIDTIIRLGYYSDAFSLFIKVGEKLASLQKPYQPHALFTILYEIVEGAPKEVLQGILYEEYFSLFKQRPKRFLENTITKEKVKEIQALFMQKEVLQQEVVHRYAHIDCAYYQDRLGYQLVLYNANQTLPKRYFIDQEEIEEIQ